MEILSQRVASFCMLNDLQDQFFVPDLTVHTSLQLLHQHSERRRLWNGLTSFGLLFCLHAYVPRIILSFSLNCDSIFYLIVCKCPPISKRQYKYWDWGIGYHERGLKVNIYCFLLILIIYWALVFKLNMWLEHYRHNPNPKLSLHSRKKSF